MIEQDCSDSKEYLTVFYVSNSDCNRLSNQRVTKSTPKVTCLNDSLMIQQDEKWRTMSYLIINIAQIQIIINNRTIDRMKSSSKPKRKASGTLPSPQKNNFSEKYLQYTRQRKFLTPKKPTHLRNDSKQSLISKKDLLEKFERNPINLVAYQKPAKININMEIKNLNFFGNPTINNPDPKKKKLHKKTISALGKHQKEITEKEQMEKVQPKKMKHTKAKSQQNIKMTAAQWGSLLAHHKKSKTKESATPISKFAFCNRKGLAADKQDKINQDTYIQIENFIMSDRYLFGVCDGHGTNGHFVSEFIREILPENVQYFFIKNKALKKCVPNIVQHSLKQAFLTTAKLLAQSGINIQFSGSTTCLLYFHQNHLFCANLGDSRAVLCSRFGEKWQHKQLSFDHKAEDEREANRIKMNGGRVFPYYDDEGDQMGPLRIWIQQKNAPGLAMTRSFGDRVASTVGVISQPQTMHFQITNNDKFVIVASDGLWEFISCEEAMELVIPAFIRNNAEEAVQILQAKAVEAWKREDQNIDDITIQVIFFKYY